MSKFDRERVNGFLHADGTKIVNGNGEEIILTGYGCGNWTNPEGFMVGAPTDIELKGDIFSLRYLEPRRLDRRRSFDRTIRELCGSAYADKFWQSWHRNHLAEADIKAMADLGLNSVRLPLNAMAFLEEEPGLNWIEDGFEMLDDVIDWCEKYRIYAILDLHAAPGGQSGTACDGGLSNSPHLFMDEENWDRALALWEKLAERYADRWIVGGYDLLNEPVSLPNHQAYVAKLAEFYDAAIKVIRKHDKNHLFTLEGPKFSRSNEIFDHDYDPECHNWCIHIHIYGASPEKQEIAWYILKGIDLNVPVWIGEGGSYPEANAVFFKIAADYGIGYNLWCWKTAMERPGQTRAVGYYLPKDWELVRSYASGGPKLGYEKSQAIFDELLENIKYENCVHNKDDIRVTRCSPELKLPAVGYDNSLGDGRSGDGVTYCGTWEHGNILGYRLSDRTKLVIAPGCEEPRPGFDMYPDPNTPKPLDPLKVLAIELAEGEFAVYTVRELTQTCSLSLEGAAKKGESMVKIEVLDEKASGVLEECACAFTEEELAWKKTEVKLPASEEGKVKITAQKGTTVLKTLHFFYE